MFSILKHIYQCCIFKLFKRFSMLLWPAWAILSFEGLKIITESLLMVCIWFFEFFLFHFRSKSFYLRLFSLFLCTRAYTCGRFQTFLQHSLIPLSSLICLISFYLTLSQHSFFMKPFYGRFIIFWIYVHFYVGSIALHLENSQVLLL